jgi:hypothetical protein
MQRILPNNKIAADESILITNKYQRILPSNKTAADGSILITNKYQSEPIPVAARSKAWVYGQSLAGVASSNSAGGMDVYLL